MLVWALDSQNLFEIFSKLEARKDARMITAKNALQIGVARSDAKRVAKSYRQASHQASRQSGRPVSFQVKLAG